MKSNIGSGKGNKIKVTMCERQLKRRCHSVAGTDPHTHDSFVCVCVCVWHGGKKFLSFWLDFFGCLLRCVYHPLLTHETWRVLELYSKGGGRPIRRYPREGSGSWRNKVGATSSDSDTCFACKHIIKDQTNNMKLTSCVAPNHHHTNPAASINAKLVRYGSGRV